ENADYFSTETPLLVTRRIVDPEAGVKFTGMQNKWGIAALLTSDEFAGERVPLTDPNYGDAADISVLRVYRDYGNQSRAGFMHTEYEFGDTYNKVSAADTFVRLTENWITELLMVNTETFEDGVVTTGRQTNWRVNRTGRGFNAHYHWTD